MMFIYAFIYCISLRGQYLGHYFLTQTEGCIKSRFQGCIDLEANIYKSF